MIKETQTTIAAFGALEDGLLPDAAEVDAVERQGTAEFTGEIHPLADLWPMIGETEMESLVEDIAANGLREPLVVDDLGRLVDGRNRLAACKRAGVSPRFVQVPSAEASALIISRNAQRRNTTGAQRAMIGVMADWDAKVGQCPTPQTRLANQYNCQRDQIAKAIRVMQWAPAMARNVADGIEKLEVAERQAISVQAASESTESRIAKLALEDEGMAELVSNKSLTLEEAEAALSERKKRHQERVVQASRQLAAILNYLDPGGISVNESVERWLFANELAATPPEDFSITRLERALTVLSAYVSERRRLENETEKMAGSGDHDEA